MAVSKWRWALIIWMVASRGDALPISSSPTRTWPSASGSTRVRAPGISRLGPLRPRGPSIRKSPTRATGAPSATTSPFSRISGIGSGRHADRLALAVEQAVAGHQQPTLGVDLDVAVAGIGPLTGRRHHRQERVAIGDEVERALGRNRDTRPKIQSGRDRGRQDLVALARREETLESGPGRLEPRRLRICEVVGHRIELGGARRRGRHAYIDPISHISPAETGSKEGASTAATM